MTMPQVSTVNTVKTIIDKQLNFAVHGYELRPDDELWALGMTSLNCVGLMLAIENEFNIELPDEVLNENTFRSVNAIATAIDDVLHVRQ
jgi:acyl carrier protein